MIRNNTAVSSANKPSLLAAVKSGVLACPSRTVLYGPEGIGKSTFAACAPSPIFLGAEEGTSQLDVSRLPEPRTWNDICDAVEELTTAQHSYHTLVLDTIDWLEPIAWDEVCRASGKQNIEDLGYGKGYVAALDLWRSLLARLDRLRSTKGMHIIALAHAMIRTFHNPAGDDYDRYELKLHARASGLWKEWCDSLLFASHDDIVRKGDNGKGRGISTGARIIHTTHNAAWDAKSRYAVPDSMALDWDEYWAAISRGAAETPEQSRKKITALLSGLDPELAKKVEKSVEMAGDNPAQLARIINKLSAIADRKEEMT